MTGAPLSTPEEVENVWLAIAVANPGGFANRPGERTLLETGEKVIARINQSRWVADCPACGGGIACWPEHPRCCCLDCGRVYEASFPSERTRKAAEKILLEHPEPLRNWFPGHESVPELRRQSDAAKRRAI